MADESLPLAVVDFLARHIATVEELEILLLLAKENGRAKSLEEVYQVIKSSRASIEQGMAKFAAAGLVTIHNATFSISPVATNSPLPEIARCYREMPVRVIGAIYQRPRDAVRDFADAFKLRRNQ
jgi:hypothetical protein